MSKANVTSRAGESTRLHDEAAALFQPRSPRRLTREDGREITRNLVGFFSLLAEWDRQARASRTGGGP
jgi:hypothetical protein